jgi:hypothetical protein
MNNNNSKSSKQTMLAANDPLYNNNNNDEGSAVHTQDVSAIRCTYLMVYSLALSYVVFSFAVSLYLTLSDATNVQEQCSNAWVYLLCTAPVLAIYTMLFAHCLEQVWQSSSIVLVPEANTKFAAINNRVGFVMAMGEGLLMFVALLHFGNWNSTQCQQYFNTQGKTVFSPGAYATILAYIHVLLFIRYTVVWSVCQLRECHSDTTAHMAGADGSGAGAAAEISIAPSTQLAAINFTDNDVDELALPNARTRNSNQFQTESSVVSSNIAVDDNRLSTDYENVVLSV